MKNLKAINQTIMKFIKSIFYRKFIGKDDGIVTTVPRKLTYKVLKLFRKRKPCVEDNLT